MPSAYAPEESSISQTILSSRKDRPYSCRIATDLSSLEAIMDLNPGGIIAWLLVGLVAGWLAGQFMKGSGYGLIGDIIMGVIGAFVGGLLFSFLLPGSSVGLIGSIVVAFIGAVVLIALIRALPGRSPV
jgi:uncharacterized membrane protein YeaQ/YmgE (transglycosylase-associated protein family)